MNKKTYPGTRKNLPTHTPPLISIGTMKREVLHCLGKGGNAHSISKKLGRKRSTIIQHLKELQTKDLTKKKDYSWLITTKGKDYLGGRFDVVGYEPQGVGTTTKWLKDRAHNIKIKVAVMERPNNMAWLSDWGKNDKLKNNVFYTQRFGEIITTYTGKSLIFQLPMLHFKNSEIAIAEAGRIAYSLIEKYEKGVYGLKLGEYDVKAQLISQHHAIPNEPYAKWLVKHGITYRDEMIDIDASKSPELEFTDKEKAHLHHSNYIDHVKDFAKQEVPKTSEIAKALAENIRQSNISQHQISHLAQAQTVTNKQFQNLISLLSPPKLVPGKKYIKRDYIG